jgi:hypothetical protein
LCSLAKRPINVFFETTNTWMSAGNITDVAIKIISNIPVALKTKVV